MFTIERWTERGITTETRATKTEANKLAEAHRRDREVIQTCVVFPNGARRFCRNPRHGAK
jgi:hypothetical protein